jgi:hypothetical protein
VTNRNKVKGDAFQRDQRDFYRTNGFPGAETTRAGYERDGGDIHLDPVVGIAPGVICQAKNWGETNWRKWLEELRAQTVTARAGVGFLAVKRRGVGDPGEQLAVMPVREFLLLLRRAGYGSPLEIEETA